jgi:hypothetical protein
MKVQSIGPLRPQVLDIKVISRSRAILGPKGVQILIIETRIFDLQSSTSNYARLYVEWNQAFDKQWSYKLWAEYVPNVDNGKSDYYSTTYEGSISVTLSDMFSLKSALIEKRQNKVTAPIKNEDRTFTTSLVANF